jgi:hypothetical protein
MSELINKLLLKTGAYKDLDQPVLLTSGEIGIYYVNTEKLLPDGGAWTKFGDDSKRMLDHVNGFMETSEDFKAVIGVLADETKKIMAGMNKTGAKDKKFAISGGQRRDWLFSGPVAKVLGLEHISLYKQESSTAEKVEIVDKSGKVIAQTEFKNDLTGYYLLHVVDLITEGSSIYKLENGKPAGWIPMLRSRHAQIDTLLSVVTRRQGGEERLKEQGVNVIAFASIDEDFVKKYSKYPERAVSYMKDPQKWSRNYLKENGALAFIEYFDPAKGNIKRASNFMERYGSALKELGRYDELMGEVKKRYS